MLGFTEDLEVIRGNNLKVTVPIVAVCGNQSNRYTRYCCDLSNIYFLISSNLRMMINGFTAIHSTAFHSIAAICQINCTISAAFC